MVETVSVIWRAADGTTVQSVLLDGAGADPQRHGYRVVRDGVVLGTFPDLHGVASLLLSRLPRSA